MRLARISTVNGPRSVVQDETMWSVVTDLFAVELVRTGECHPVDGAQLLAPVEPRIVLGMAHNSGSTDRQLPPQAFMKSARTVVGPLEPIHLNTRIGRVVVEGELALVVRRICRDLTPEEVPGAILGWTIGNDVTATDQIALDEKMTQAKNGDGFTPLGPWIETDLDPRAVDISVSVDGQIVAGGSTSELAWDVVEQLVYLSSFLTLGPGDVILTGAPQTSAAITAGQLAEISLSGIGTLSNPAVGTRRSESTKPIKNGAPTGVVEEA